MKRSPKDTLKRILQVGTAWARLRPAKLFAGLTLEGYRAIIQPSLDARAEIEELQSRLKAAITRREAADKVSFEVVRRVRFGVIADQHEGDDGALYAAMGYVRRSVRRSGLVRKHR